MRSKTSRRTAAVTAATVVAAGLLALQPQAAHATDPILPGNEGDVGVYTNGANHSMDIGEPTYNNSAGTVSALQPSVPFSAGNMQQSQFDADLAAGGTSYYLDRILGVQGNIGSAILMTRGRSLYMRGVSNANFTAMGFSGSAYAGGPNNLGNFYTVTVPGQTVTEVAANRFNAPSHAKTRYNVGSTGVTIDQTKLITYDNVALTALTLTNPGASDVNLTVRTAAPLATTPDGTDGFKGRKTLTSGSNNGLLDTPWQDVNVRLKAKGFTANGTNLERTVTVPAGGSTSLSITGVLYPDTLPQSYDSFLQYEDMAPADAVREGITAFNRRWAQDIPYINVPDPGVEKAIVYRWWGERYNSLDANAPGYVYQYPTTQEGVNLYQNSIVLTQPMHLQDTKWMRNPYLSYGQLLNVGELSGSSAFLDSPGHTSWNNHYSQYIGTAGLEAYNVHGGGPEVAKKFAGYFENDGVGQLEHYDGNGNNLIAYDFNSMPGNDADALTFGYPKATATAPGARTIERPESAYVWGDFEAARQLYQMSGAPASKVEAMSTKADAIRDAILTNLWSPDMKMFLARTSYGAKSAASSGTKANPLPVEARDLIPAKESNLYDVYAENLIPKEDAAQYVDGFRFLTYGDNFPIFPFYTANQYDKNGYGIGGSNNFSNINFTVEYRGIRSALRYYDPTHKYVTPAYARRLLNWMAWSTYPGGDMRIPNQGEYYSNWNATAKTYNRNNPYHVMLGNMNYIYVEDMGGIQPRSDNKIELYPIDLGYDHFMVNNLRYHDQDVTIVWDQDGSHYGMGTGYSLFINGQKKVTAATLGHLVYDPAANTVDADAGVNITFTDSSGASVPTAVNTPIEDQRVVSYLKTAGIDLTEDATNLVAGSTLSSSYTQQGTRPASWRQFHTPGYSTSTGNYTPGATKELEKPVSLDAVKDGVTANEPYWGNYGTTENKGYIQVDFDGQKTLDNVKTWFVSDRSAGGYHEPARWYVQIPDGSGGWKAVDGQSKQPTVPTAKFNEALFPAITTDKIRIAFNNSSTYYTAISEIQAFNSGREIPAAENVAPVVTVQRDTTNDGNVSTKLVATATDDGIPYDDELTFGWSLVSAPAGASAIISNPNALTTTVTGTAAGSYVFRFTADDGEKQTTADLTVSLTAKAVVAEFGSTATITSNGQASWENQNNVNAATTPTSSNPGTGQGWGNWGTTNNGTTVAKQAILQYTWDSPLRLSSTDIYWYDDNGGTRRPTATTYAIEYSNNGTDWTAVTLNGGSTYAAGLVTNTYNHFNFQPINAKHLRIRIFGLMGAGAGTGVLRWRANGEKVQSVASPVIMRTPTGTVPTLPSSLEIVYESGARGTANFTWQPITPAMVAEANVEPFTVYGTSSAYGLIAEAQVYVRPENSTGGIVISGAEQFTQHVEVGEQPYLPNHLLVNYNDGSKDNRAIGIDWDFDPATVNTPGVYTITGDLILPSYVGTSGITSTTLTLTVGDGITPDRKVTGAITSGGTPVPGVCVYLYTARNAPSASFASCTAADGTYTIPNITSGTYEVAVSDPTGGFATQWRDTPVTVANSPVTGVDFALADDPHGHLKGTVTETGTGTALSTICVFAYERGVTTAAKYATCTDSAGGYGLYGIDAGQYDVAFFDPTGQHPTQWWTGTAGGAPSQAGAAAVVVPARGGNITADASMARSTLGAVTGTVRDSVSTTGLATACVYLYTDAAGPAAFGTCTQPDGTYYLGNVPAGTYKLAFAAPGAGYNTQWWTGTAGGAATYAGGATITVTGGQTLSAVDAAMAQTGARWVPARSR